MELAASRRPGVDTVRIEAFERREVLVRELAQARQKYQQLTFVIEYLEGELS